MQLLTSYVINYTRRKPAVQRIACGLAVCITAFMPPAIHAAPATLATDAELRTERYVDAATLTHLAKGTHVETLASEAGWIKVRTGDSTGWLRASQVAEIADTPVHSTRDGRNGTGNIMAISGLRSMPRPLLHASAALLDVHAQRDAKRAVSLTPRNAVLSIGKDALDLSVTSSHDGYLYLIVLGSDNQSLYVLFPNDIDRDNAIKARQTINLPRRRWAIRAQGPSGTDKILAVVTDSPRDISALGNNRIGPFYSLTADSEGHPDLQWLLHPASAAPSSSACSDRKVPTTRNLPSSCADTFGSALVDIVEK
jgi:hypothetical protein